MSGKVVHDMNGDAVFNLEEPVIPGVRICINREPLPPICAYSNSDGSYVFEELLPGAWNFQISSPSIKRLEEFKYTNQLIEADHHVPETTINGHTITERTLNLTELNPIENEILVLVNEDIQYDLFLMHEWATYFAAPKDADKFKTEAYLDYDVRPGVTRIYNGERGLTYDQHDGLDTSCPRGTEIVSVAEGRVIAILDNSTVVIQHVNQLISVYGHGDPLVEENQFVPRGFPVALCNNHLTDSDPHLHFAVWQSNPWLHLVNYGIPAFADLVITEERWVANLDPLEKDHFVYLLQGGRGIWTEINQPHLPYVRLLEE
jgi:murein DD-endopeptidase MepM/ murein hydrolase activator NlpD